MSDKEIIAPKEEEKKEEVKADEPKPTEGTMEAELAKEAPTEAPKVKEAETVPLATFLDVKRDLKELKREIRDAKSSDRQETALSGVQEIANKYPDVNQDFIADILKSATANAQSKVEEKYSPIFAKQDADRKQVAFDKAFDKLYDKTLEENPNLPTTVDKKLLKTLALTPNYRNVPLADIIGQMGGVTNDGSSSSENEVRASSDRVDDLVSFDKITPDQKKAIMSDEKVRTKYFDWLDTQ